MSQSPTHTDTQTHTCRSSFGTSWAFNWGIVGLGGAGKLQLSQSSPGNFGGSYFGQNITKKNISATSVLLNYPKACPLTNFFFKIYILGYMKNDKIAVARSLCVGLIRSRKETPTKIKFWGGGGFVAQNVYSSEIQPISHF